MLYAAKDQISYKGNIVAFIKFALFHRLPVNADHILSKSFVELVNSSRAIVRVWAQFHQYKSGKHRFFLNNGKHPPKHMAKFVKGAIDTGIGGVVGENFFKPGFRDLDKKIPFIFKVAINSTFNNP